jgi:hypothetical protein
VARARWARINDVIQDGVYYQVTSNVGHLRAWYEYYPGPATYTNFVLSPYDSVDFWAWEGDSGCNYGPNPAGYGCFWYENKTAGTTNGIFAVKIPAGAPAFTGATAEGVIERVNGAYLASWATDSAFMALDAHDWSWGYHDIFNGPDLNMTLDNAGGAALATAANVGDTNSMQFNWVKSH